MKILPYPLLALAINVSCIPIASGAEPGRAFIDGTEPGWQALDEGHFVNVNCDADTWQWQGQHVSGTGKPLGVIRTKDQYTNFELIAEWKHSKAGGNSGIFIWAPPQAFEDLKPGTLPKAGIEVQVLDHGYTQQYEESTGKPADWFTTHGDVFPVGTSKMTPFEPMAPGGGRSFPRKKLSKGVGQWNHYYIRAINGEIRLWVNGEEVSGGSDCQPASGYICLESEGAPIEFRNLRIRMLP